METNKRGCSSSWDEWSKYVLLTLEAQASGIKNIQETIQQIKVDIAMLQVKSSMWGFCGGLLSVLVFLVVGFIKR